MKDVLKSQYRGKADFGWLKSYHSFSFGDYYNPEMMGFRNLRVINEDFIKAGTGFPTHPHRDMEIVTYMISGAIAHEDSLGNKEVLRRGEFQRMTAGAGIRHSEQVPESDEDTHLLQIWIMPNKTGLTPSYEQRSFIGDESKTSLSLLVSGDPKDNVIAINQDVKIYRGLVNKGESVDLRLADQRFGWVQVVKGKFSDEEKEIHKGDALVFDSGKPITIKADEPLEFLFFDLN